MPATRQRPRSLITMPSLGQQRRNAASARDTMMRSRRISIIWSASRMSVDGVCSPPNIASAIQLKQTRSQLFHCSLIHAGISIVESQQQYERQFAELAGLKRACASSTSAGVSAIQHAIPCSTWAARSLVSQTACGMSSVARCWPSWRGWSVQLRLCQADFLVGLRCIPVVNC
jgi:hypothetical protein